MFVGFRGGGEGGTRRRPAARKPREDRRPQPHTDTANRFRPRALTLPPPPLPGSCQLRELSGFEWEVVTVSFATEVVTPLSCQGVLSDRNRQVKNFLGEVILTRPITLVLSRAHSGFIWPSEA